MALTSCNNNSKTKTTTYLGGEIINPKDNFVLLYKDDVLLDSITLDEKNRFMYIFENISPGLYHFKHKEYQYVYIEPQDSILFRLNTIDFDESLTFSGKGAHKNNFMINTFLANENHKEKSNILFKNPPKKFSTLISNELKQRLNTLEKYKERYEFSEGFVNIAKAHIYFHYFTLKERYPIYNNKESDAIDKESFYNYRKFTDLENNNFGSFYPYYEYLYSLIDNLNMGKVKKSTDNKYIANYDSEISIIDSLFTNEDLKNQILKNTTLDYLKGIKCEKDAKVIHEKFNSINSNAKNREKITDLVKTIECLGVGKKIPDFNVINYTDKIIPFKNTLKNKPTVVYFWSSKYPRHMKSIQNKIATYKNTKYNFIGISLDKEKTNWKKYAKLFNFNYEYSLENPNETRKILLIQNINKTYVLNKNAEIVCANLNMFDPQFNTKLNALDN
jgi:peroxiredoxin